LASRKKNYRNRNSSNRYDDGYNQQTYSGNHRSNHSGQRENHYFCEICGYTMPQSGNTPPTCTRCLIPMTIMRTGSLTRSKNDKKPAYDYSSKFYFQTDGHPQYKGLPLDHPDPDDIEAMEAYKLRKQIRRKRSGKPSGDDYGSQEKHVKSPRKQKQSVISSNHSRRSVDHKQSRETVSQVPNTSRDTSNDTPADYKPYPPNDSDKRKHTQPERSTPRKAARQNDSLFVHDTPKSPREEDYAGTALTSNRSAATILSDTLNEKHLESSGDLRSDYAFHQTESASESPKKSPAKKIEPENTINPQ
jgi:hypothetical protein